MRPRTPARRPKDTNAQRNRQYWASVQRQQDIKLGPPIYVDRRAGPGDVGEFDEQTAEIHQCKVLRDGETLPNGAILISKGRYFLSVVHNQTDCAERPYDMREAVKVANQIRADVGRSIRLAKKESS